MNSNYCDWSFFFSIPYDTIYLKFQSAVKLALIFYLAIFFILILFSVLLSDSITKPLNSLINKMQNISEFNFTVANNSLGASGRKDELGLLRETYQTMLNEIKNLIQENYIKQLTIKDTQYRSLQAKINPHFIYNTLDSIYWMAVNEKQQDISIMVFSLGQLLREFVKSSNDYKYLI
ncbi:MAG: histidine kinase, partial [Candidatus Cloacimonadaceae bacterium]